MLTLHTMEHQDWTTVVLKRRLTKREEGRYIGTEVRDVERNERSRLTKIAEADYTDVPKKQAASESLQDLIRKRMELKLSQEKADQLCNFPRYTIKGIESRRVLPTPLQQSAIQKHFNVRLKIVTK